MLSGLKQFLRSIQGRLTSLVAIIVTAAVLSTAGLDLALRAEMFGNDIRQRALHDAQIVSSTAIGRLRRGQVDEFQKGLVQVLGQQHFDRFNVIDPLHDTTYFGMEGARSQTGLAPDPLVAHAISSRSVQTADVKGHYRLVLPVIEGDDVVALIDIVADVTLPLGKLLEMLGGAGVVALILIGFFVPLGLLLAQSIAKPLHAITAVARRVREGDLDMESLPTSNGEIGDLSETLNEMVTHLRQDTTEIRRLAFTDTVTGLANRERFRSFIEAALKHHAQTGVARALFFIDLDHFKQVNDIYGHTQGDMVLSMIAQRFGEACLAQGFPPGDPTEKWVDLPQEARIAALARHAGDEFTVMVRNHEGRHELAALASAFCTAAKITLDLDGVSLALSASVGIVDFDDALDASPSDLIRFSDLAMYEAKRAGRDGYLQFTPDLEQRSRDRLILEMELRKAIRAGEFRVYYMPQVSLSGGLCRAVEALVRWEHPRRGLLLPGTFLDLAEETGLLVQIDRFVLNEACRQMAEWRGRGLRMTVAVNVSPSDFHRPDFVDGILTALERHDVEPSCLELELTETIAMASPARVAAIVTQLRAVGIRFALDDFGTGYSNLGHLTTLSFDTLKIDRSFTRALSEVERADAELIIETILSLARKLGVVTVAEGVETPDQVSWLRQNGCAIGQGYYFGEPMTAGEFERQYFEQNFIRAGAA